MNARRGGGGICECATLYDMRFILRVPPDNQRGPLYFEQALAAIHQANHDRRPLMLAIQSAGRTVQLVVECPLELAGAIRSAVFAAIPDATLDPCDDDVASEGAVSMWQIELRLTPDLFPIRRYPEFDDANARVIADPMAALLSAIADDRRGCIRSNVIWEIQPAAEHVIRRYDRALRRLHASVFHDRLRLAAAYLRLALSPYKLVRCAGWAFARLIGASAPRSPEYAADHRHSREDPLQAAADKLRRHLFTATLRITVRGSLAHSAAVQDKLRELAGAFGVFSDSHRSIFRTGRYARRGARLRRLKPFLLSAEEVATLWHPPTATVRVPGVSRVIAREFPPPPDLPLLTENDSLAVLGTTAFRGRYVPFGLKSDDRLRHVALLGKTGQGKTTLLHHLAVADIRAGHGIALIDPHGDLFEALLTELPRQRTNDIVLFDATDIAHPPAFNPLACPNPAHRPLVASAVLSAFKKLFREFWGPRMEYVFRHALLAVLETPQPTLMSLLRLLSDGAFRQVVISQVADPVVREFWLREFASLPVRLQAETVAPIQNKVGAFVSSPILRNIVNQTGNRIDLRQVMDDGRVMLVNLSKGKLGEDASALLGALLVSQLQLAAMSRADVPEARRRDFFVYVDEFQNFATDSFAATLAEARKYRLGLTVANQYLAQLDEATLHAVFGNVGTLVSFQVGAKDAELLAEQFGGDLTSADLLRLPRYHAHVRLLIDGSPSLPFTMRTMPLGEVRSGSQRAEVLRRIGRRRFGSRLAPMRNAH